MSIFQLLPPANLLPVVGTRDCPCSRCQWSLNSPEGESRSLTERLCGLQTRQLCMPKHLPWPIALPAENSESYTSPARPRDTESPMEARSCNFVKVTNSARLTRRDPPFGGRAWTTWMPFSYQGPKIDWHRFAFPSTMKETLAPAEHNMSIQKGESSVSQGILPIMQETQHVLQLTVFSKWRWGWWACLFISLPTMIKVHSPFPNQANFPTLFCY